MLASCINVTSCLFEQFLQGYSDETYILDDLKHSPLSLVTLAYQAGLCSQEIPGWKSFIVAHQHQKISSLDLVEKAVEAYLLPAQLLTNQEYINAVETGLYLYYSKQPELKAVSLIDKFWTKLAIPKLICGEKEHV